MDKFNIDLFDVSAADFSVKSIRAMYIVAVITGRIELARILVKYDTDIMGDYLVGRDINKNVI